MANTSLVEFELNLWADGMKFLVLTLNKLNGIYAHLLQCYLIMICDNVSRKIAYRANEIDFIMKKTNNHYKGHDFFILFYRMVAGRD